MAWGVLGRATESEPTTASSLVSREVPKDVSAETFRPGGPLGSNPRTRIRTSRKPNNPRGRSPEGCSNTPDRIRTCDLCLRRAALYPAELRAQRVSSARNKPSSVRRISIASRQRRQRGGIIYLGPTLLPASSSLPGTQVVRAAPRPLFGLAPGGVCRATSVTSGPVRSYRTLSPLPVRLARTLAAIGGLLSAALSVVLRRPGVTRHPALWSSDFPPGSRRTPAIPTRTLPTDKKSGHPGRIT